MVVNLGQLVKEEVNKYFEKLREDLSVDINKYWDEED